MTIEPASGREPDDDNKSDIVHYRVLSAKTIWWAAAFILLVGVGVAAWLLLAYGGGDPQQRNQLEAIKTAGTIVVGTGGAAALLLAARRQRTAEIALKQKERDQRHQERVAAVTEFDAIERRITELYTKAADQLGSDKAAVRLAGLYALERLAQNNLDQRQVIVNVLCAYLRMPYVLPDDSAPEPSADREVREAYRELVQEREVRLAAQRILVFHLQQGTYSDQSLSTFWGDIDIDLTGATLIDFDLSLCRIRTAQFRRAVFAGGASFHRTEFTGDAMFGMAAFAGNPSFSNAKFAGSASFNGAKFAWAPKFSDAKFAGYASFSHAKFAGYAKFKRTEFAGIVWFATTEFVGGVSFSGAKFAGSVLFIGTNFVRDPALDAWVRMDVDTDVDREWPTGWSLPTVPASTLPNHPGKWMQLVREETADSEPGQSQS